MKRLLLFVAVAFTALMVDAQIATRHLSLSEQLKAVSKVDRSMSVVVKNNAAKFGVAKKDAGVIELISVEAEAADDGTEILKTSSIAVYPKGTKISYKGQSWNNATTTLGNLEGCEWQILFNDEKTTFLIPVNQEYTDPEYGLIYMWGLIEKEDGIYYDDENDIVFNMDVESGMFECENVGWAMKMTGEYEQYVWTSSWYPSWMIPNGVETGSLGKGGWSTYTNPIFVEDLGDEVNVYNFFGYTKLNILFDEETGSYLIPMHQPIYPMGSSYDHSTYGYYFRLLGADVNEEGNLRTNEDKEYTAAYLMKIADDEEGGHLEKAENNILTDPSREGYMGIFSQFDAEGQGYYMGYLHSINFTLNEGNYNAYVGSKTDSLYIKNTEIELGESVIMSINMRNADAITAMQFDVVIPEGLELALDSNGAYDITLADRASDHVVHSAKMEDGSIRVLCYSPSLSAFSGANGAVVNMKITGGTSGTYAVQLKNINLTDTDKKAHRIQDVSGTVTVLAGVIMGDVNGDLVVNNTDIVTTVSFILGEEVANFNAKAADMNGDEYIDVTDVVYIAEVILNGAPNSISAASVAQGDGTMYLTIPEFSMTANGESANVGLNLASVGDQFTSFQCDVYMPKGISIAKNNGGAYNVTFNETRTSDMYHTLGSALQEDESVRLLCYSLRKKEIQGENDAVLYIPFEAAEGMQAGEYEIRIENVTLTRSDNTAVQQPSFVGKLVVNESTGIANVENTTNAPAAVYSVAGQRLDKQQAGLNIVVTGKTAQKVLNK